MKLSEIKGEKAIDAMADLLDPLSAIFLDEVIQKSMQRGEPKLLLAKKILKGHKKEVINILAILDGEDPDNYEIDLLTLPKKLIEVINDPKVNSLFS